VTQDLSWRLAAILLAPVFGALAGVLSARLPALQDDIGRPSRIRLAAMAAGGLLAGLWAAWALDGPLALIGAALGAGLLLIAVVDAEHFWLPNLFTLPLGAAGLVVSAVFGPGRFVDHVIGAAVGFFALAGLAALYRRLRGREGLGGGDARLLAAIGAWVGWAGLPTVLVWGSAAGLSWVVARAAARRALRWDEAMPYGVCLALGAWLTWLYGPLGLAGW
jgi:leader peptidase (prepilin peptidase)/N-methyltransferase